MIIDDSIEPKPYTQEKALNNPIVLICKQVFKNGD
jgi:hypothetical protein